MKKTLKPRVIILGATGMLGSLVFEYLQQNPDLIVLGTARRTIAGMLQFDAADFVAGRISANDLQTADYIINCIGIIKPHCHDDNEVQVANAIAVNALFPHALASELAKLKKSPKIIQIATDCVYSGKTGDYLESALHDPIDVYGKTKSLGEVRLENLLNIRCSIIGPEKGTSLSLLEWFLHQPSKAKLSGYDNHFWNGITTLQFAELCEKIIMQNSFANLVKTNHLHHFLPNEKVTKFELLQIFQKVFMTDYVIAQTSAATGMVDRSLKTNFTDLELIYPVTSMLAAITHLKEFIDHEKV
jgi:dTDP-4-dehydrorhamnose reductase